MARKIVTIPLVMEQHNFDALVKAHDDEEAIYVSGISLMPVEEGVRLIVRGSHLPENEARGFNAGNV
jgi:hypothetical protein